MKATAEQSMHSKAIPTPEVGRGEMVWGHGVAPAVMCLVYSVLSGQYLIQFYTDVLGLDGQQLAWMTLLVKGVSAAAGLWFGRKIDRTRTPQGKARPWLPLAGLLMECGGWLLYGVPRLSQTGRMMWVTVSYLLFFCVALSIYSLSHALMVPLATRNTQKRDQLAMISSLTTSMVPGVVLAVGMPLLVRWMGVGVEAQGRWLRVMGALSVLAIPAALLEYRFTRERVTEEWDHRTQPISRGRQLKALLTNPVWLQTALFTLLLTLTNSVVNGSMLYYCNWVLGSSVQQGAGIQILVTMIGQSPLGSGVLALWPLVRRFGRRRLAMTGFAIAALGSLLTGLAGQVLPLAMAGVLVRSVGMLPVYLLPAFQAEAVDCVESRSGFRADGLSASLNGIAVSVAAGLGQSLVLLGMERFGYAAPADVAQILVQPQALRSFLALCFAYLPALGFLGCTAVLLLWPGKKRRL